MGEGELKAGEFDNPDIRPSARSLALQKSLKQGRPLIAGLLYIETRVAQQVGCQSGRGGLPIRTSDRKHLLTLQGKRHGGFSTAAGLRKMGKRPVKEVKFTDHRNRGFLSLLK